MSALLRIRGGVLELSDALLEINPHLRPVVVGARAPRPQGQVEVRARRSGSVVVLVLKGLRLVSEANARGVHWARTRRAKRARQLVAAALATVQPLTTPAEVYLVRVGPRALDGDNLQTAFKSVRDGVAEACGVDDGPDAPLTWRYEQRRGGYAVEVTITEGAR